MKNRKRKTRSDKFPLTRHPTGQYCKKAKGKMYCFGSDNKSALQRYLNHAAHFHGDQSKQQRPIDDTMILKQLCEKYLSYQFLKVQSNDPTARHYNDEIACLNKLMNFLGHGQIVEDILMLVYKTISNCSSENMGRHIDKICISAF